MPFEKPQLLLLIIPAIAILLYIIRKDFVPRLQRKDMRQHVVRLRSIVLVSRILIFTLLIIAMAVPYSLDSVLKRGDPMLTILTDNSTSMDALDASGMPALVNELEKKIPVRQRSFASSEISPVGDAILSAVSGNDNILLVSDGNSNNGRSLGDMVVVAAAMNSTVNAISLPVLRGDASVAISGPRITTNAEENEFEIIVNQIGPPSDYQLRVFIDGQLVLDSIYKGSSIATVSRKFAEGYHTIKAEIVINDYFSQNNEFYKTVKVEQKPRVLFVTKSASPLSSVFSTLYRTTATPVLSGDISQYSAVILNDIPVGEIDEQRLSDYVIDGNGLVVIGGKNSYDRGRYKDSLFENMLPVKVGRGKDGKRTDVSIALVIDISGSTGSGFSEESSSRIEEVEKALSIAILNDLRAQDKVSVVAFNTESYIVSDLTGVLGNQEYIGDRIERLVYKGGTRIDEGIKAARKILAPLEGSKNMIIFSDGKSGSYTQDLYDAQIAANTGIKIYTVGVGEGTNSKHMQDIADAGNGFYFEPEETERLKVLFGEPESQAGSGNFNFEVINSHHFITHNVHPSGAVTGFNQVIPKANADLLVATDSNNPLMSASRLGLGRVVAITTDDGSAWAADMLAPKNSVLISRGVNWAVGDLSRNKGFDVDVRDVYLGDAMDVNVISSSEPSHSTLEFSKIGKRLYSSSFTPQEQGIQRFFGATAAVNYPEEYLILGMNSQLDGILGITGGKLFNPDDADGIVEKVKEDSKRIISEPRTFSWIFLLMALLIFLAEIALRRLQEAKQ